MKNGKPVLGIIGCGGIARGSHAPSLKQLEAQGVCEVVACADVVPEAAQAMAERFGIPRDFADYRELLALDELDGVTIATPPFVHKEATIAALRAGKHVLCEKPMAMNVAEAKEMIAVARETGKVLTIGHGGRFSPVAQAIHRRAAAGDLGEIYYAKAAALRKRGVPARGVFTVKKLNGGGPLIDIGVHALDLAVWLMGNPPPVGVFGATYDKLAHRPGVASQNRLGSTGAFDPERYDVEDLCAGLIRFANGATLYLETSWLLNQADDERRWTELYGTTGSATTNPFRILIDDSTGLKDETPAVPTGRAGFQGNFLRFQRFVDCIAGRAEPLVKPEESLNVQRIIDGLYQSAEAGKAVEITG
ncbi:MAG: Gfo/Idh/MocA family oxidoreductase [Chloroflexi bacterium]|nr:Gfo/Idh/MocA family oxidoreductase [Chloroflexota bacterium]